MTLYCQNIINCIINLNTEIIIIKYIYSFIIKVLMN
jgi:hypothetical protein